MANNAHVNKVIYGGQTLIDLTDTTFDPDTLPLGSVVYNAAGARVTGSAIVHHVYTDTTANWNAKTAYAPAQGDIIVYTDRATVTEDNVTKNVPGIKIGDGNAYVVDLPFTDDALAAALLAHIGNTTAHITSGERAAWNNKVSVSTSGKALIFSTN